MNKDTIKAREEAELSSLLRCKGKDLEWWKCNIKSKEWLPAREHLVDCINYKNKETGKW